MAVNFGCSEQAELQVDASERPLQIVIIPTKAELVDCWVQEDSESPTSTCERRFDSLKQ